MSGTAGDAYDDALGNYYRARARVRELTEVWRNASVAALKAAGQLTNALDDYDRAADALIVAEDLQADG